MRTLDAFFGETRVGTLQQADDNWRFSYDKSWSDAAGSFDLSPGLTRSQRPHVDTTGNRLVQSYFENLLPEAEYQRATFQEAGIKGEDTFALLEYLGEESTGALSFRAPGQGPRSGADLRELPDRQLSKRIVALSHRPLAADAPKRVAIAGAQHKLAIVMKNDRLFEPLGTATSTHILKPDHPKSLQYPASAINEYIVMRLARAAGLVVPDVHLRYAPEAVYVVERFDRVVHAIPSKTDADAQVARIHVIDACQLLDIPRETKYQVASMQALERIISLTTDEDHTRLALYRWLVFNVLVGNDDAHLKNLSFFVSAGGITIAPHYDLLATGVYRTRAITDRSGWPWTDMIIQLREASCFGQVTRNSMIRAAQEIGLSSEAAGEVLDDVIGRVSAVLDDELDAVSRRHAALDERSRVHVATEAWVLRILKNIIFREMFECLTRSWRRPDAF